MISLKLCNYIGITEQTTVVYGLSDNNDNDSAFSFKIMKAEISASEGISLAALWCFPGAGWVMGKAEPGARKAGPEPLMPHLISSEIRDQFSEAELPCL